MKRVSYHRESFVVQLFDSIAFWVCVCANSAGRQQHLKRYSNFRCNRTRLHGYCVYQNRYYTQNSTQIVPSVSLTLCVSSIHPILKLILYWKCAAIVLNYPWLNGKQKNCSHKKHTHSPHSHRQTNILSVWTNTWILCLLQLIPYFPMQLTVGIFCCCNLQSFVGCV